jgi:hypothetical protein
LAKSFQNVGKMLIKVKILKRSEEDEEEEEEEEEEDLQFLDQVRPFRTW